MSDADVSGDTRRARRGGDKTAVLLVVTGTFGLQGLTMVSGVIAARMLGVEARGQVALVFVVAAICSQLTFGGSLPNAVAKLLAERGIAARDGLRRIARRWSAGILAPGAVAVVVLLALERHGFRVDELGLLAAVFVMTLETIAFRVLVGCLQGEVGHLGRMMVVAIVPQLAYTSVLGVALLAGWHWGPLTVLIVFLAASALGVVLGAAALAPASGRIEDELDEHLLWGTTRQTYVSSIGPIDGLGLDKFLVGGLLGTVALGLYTAAAAVANLCSFVGNTVSVILLPRVAMASRDAAAQRAVIVRWLVVAGLINAATVCAVELAAGPLIRIAFGEDFAGAVAVARWLVLADGLLGFRRVLIAVLQGQGMGARASWIELALTPAMIAGTVVASSQDSLVGVGLTMVAVGLLSCMLLGDGIRRVMQSRRDEQALEPLLGA